ncbi:MAG: hypothetical protein E6I91_21910 [Chloroflexi bacterium]|nr:MAG: hypothetical protein E6I91_21910 [Chloroflexota bacterium]
MENTSHHQNLQRAAMTAEQLRHLSPMDWEHIGLTGDYTWDFTVKNTRA